MTATTGPLLDITVVCVGARWKILVGGELDTASGGELVTVADTLALAHAEHADIDLSNVSFTDTAGWRAVSKARQRIADGGGVARIVDPSPAVEYLVRMAGFDGELAATA